MFISMYTVNSNESNKQKIKNVTKREASIISTTNRIGEFGRPSFFVEDWFGAIGK